MKRERRAGPASRKKTRGVAFSERNPIRKQDLRGNHLEGHILNFSRHAQIDKSSEVFSSALSLSFIHNNDGTSRDEEMHHTISSLSSFLLLESSKESITKIHIASLIFPWVTQSLIQNQENSSDVIWEAFSRCLEMLLLGRVTEICNEESTLDSVLSYILEETKDGSLMKYTIDTHARETISSVMTQGIMNKLVMCFLRTALKNRERREGLQLVIMAQKCYGLIVTSEFYRPTMDYVCNTLLPFVDELISDVEDEFMKNRTPNQAALIYFTIQLLTALHLKGRASNQKKTFQLVASPQTLSSMSKFSNIIHYQDSGVDINSIIKKVIMFALYDPIHIDGFRSMNLEIPSLNQDAHQRGKETKNKNRQSGHSCYQQSLMNSVKTLVAGTDMKKDWKNEHIIRFIPILIEGFIHQSLEFDKSAIKKKFRVDTAARIQFRFVSAFLNPIVELMTTLKNNDVDRSKEVTMLRSIEECMQILLSHSIYLPSFEDEGNLHINYLSTVGEVLLCLAEQKIGKKSVSEYISIFHSLFVLNHHTFHNKLPRLIRCIVRCEEVSMSRKLICTLCSTYQKLRQMGHFITDILSFDQGGKFEDEMNTKAKTYSFVHDPTFLQAVTRAIQSSPIGQTQEVWDIINRNVIDTAKTKSADALIHSVDVFVVILKAIRVGPFSSKTVEEMCKKTMVTSVSFLLGLGDGNVQLLSSGLDFTNPKCSSGLYLWSWVVNVRTKCCFWLNQMPHEVVETDGEERNDEIFGARNLTTVLLTSIESAMSSPFQEGTHLEALQLLSCHRLQQLHSSIYQQQLMEGSNEKVDATKLRSGDMIGEAKQLVKFIIFSARNRRAGWKIVCENMVNWLPYAEAEHINSFLRWFICIQAPQGGCKKGGTISVPCLDVELSMEEYLEERAPAETMLHDASFFETPGIFECFARISLSCVSSLLFHERQLNPNNFHGIFQILTSKPSETKNCAFTHIREATSIMNLLLLVSSSCEQFENLCLILEQTLRIHKIAFEYCSLNKGFTVDIIENGIKLMCVCRELLSVALKGSTGGGILCGDGKKSLLPCILEHLFSSTETLFEILEEPSNEYISYLKQDVSASCSTVLKNLVLYTINSFDYEQLNREALPVTLKRLLKDSVHSESQCHHFAKLLRPSLHLLNSAADLRQDKEFSSFINKVLLAVQPLNKLCVLYLQSNFSTDGNGAKASILIDCIYFVADHVISESRVSGGGKCLEGDEDIMKSIEQIFKKMISFLLAEIISDNSALHEAVLYMFGSIVGEGALHMVETLDAKLNIQRITLHQCKGKHGRVHPILDSTYAKILCDMSAEEVSILVGDLSTRLLQSDGNERISLLLATSHCFHIMAHVVKGQNQRGVLSCLSSQLLPAVFDLIHPFSEALELSHDRWSVQLRAAQGLICTMIGKNDLIMFKGSDISNILATTNNTFHVERDDNGSHPGIDRNIYASSCAVIASLLKNYPKQVYGCIPSLAGVLRNLLKHVMKCRSDEVDVAKKIQDFRKVCELLPEHKDVIKKHVMHVVLCYIDEKQHKFIDARIKAKLEPSIFLLLDTISEFEIKQLNTMMRPAEKALFQSVFKSYQKYQYKGQF